jgi:hypothetical protein
MWSSVNSTQRPSNRAIIVDDQFEAQWRQAIRLIAFRRNRHLAAASLIEAIHKMRCVDRLGAIGGGEARLTGAHSCRSEPQVNADS